MAEKSLNKYSGVFKLDWFLLCFFLPLWDFSILQFFIGLEFQSWDC